jgi:hypothetical protein
VTGLSASGRFLVAGEQRVSDKLCLV